MSEYIGSGFVVATRRHGKADAEDDRSRISLISKRDIRCVAYARSPGGICLHWRSYVGTLHEINSENSTVALEQVKSYGTEGRSEEEVPPSDNVYEYIVFRGSDVKDLRIEKEPDKKPQQPQVPDDPAILGVSCQRLVQAILCAILSNKRTQRAL